MIQCICFLYEQSYERFTILNFRTLAALTSYTNCTLTIFFSLVYVFVTITNCSLQLKLDFTAVVIIHTKNFKGFTTCLCKMTCQKEKRAH